MINYSAVTAPWADIIGSTNEIFGSKISEVGALYIDIETANLLKTTYRATNSDETIWDLAQTDNLWTQYTGKPVEFRIVAELKTAGAGGTKRALYGFPESDEVWEMSMAMRPRVLRMVEQTYYIQAPMAYKISGLNGKRPGGMRYIDDI